MVFCTLNCQFHFAASGRNTGVAATMRRAMVVTRVELRPVGVEDALFARLLELGLIGLRRALFDGFGATSICCLRSTPTAPAFVVLTVSQPATASTQAATEMTMIFFMR